MEFKLQIGKLCNFINTLLLHFGKNAYIIVVNHFQSLFTAFDVVKVGQHYLESRNDVHKKSTLVQTPQVHLNLNYLIPELTMLYVALDSLRVLYCNDFHYYSTSMPLENTLFSHFIFPPELWHITDISSIFITSTPLVAFFFLLFDKPVDSKYLMYMFRNEVGCFQQGPVFIVQNGKRISQLETEKIAAFCSKIKRFLPLNILILFLVVDAFSIFNFCFIHWTGTFYSCFLFIMVNFFIFYSLTSKFFV